MLAQRAMASLARASAKSSLLAGGGGGNPGCGGSFGAAMAATAATRTSSDVAAFFGGSDDGGGRPRLHLHPRGAAAAGLHAGLHACDDASAAGTPGARVPSSSTSDSGSTDTAEHSCGSVASSAGGGLHARPRLHLQPRSTPLAGGAASGSAGSSGAAPSRASSVFGGAKPREEVLRARGVDPLRDELERELRLAGDAAAAAPGGGRGADEDEWHTVTGRRGRAGGHDALAGGRDAGWSLVHGGGGGAPAFGSPAAGGGWAGRGGGGGVAEEEVAGEGAGIFRRALPMRVERML